jgi:hypothetical protein
MGLGGKGAGGRQGCIQESIAILRMPTPFGIRLCHLQSLSGTQDISYKRESNSPFGCDRASVLHEQGPGFNTHHCTINK